MMTPESHRCGPIVVGSGISGLSAALGLEGATVITSGEVRSGSSPLAQGGIAGAVGADDTPTSHAADTLAVSGGIADPGIASMVTAAAPDRIEWLDALGARFDRDDDGRLSLGREAGHSARRIVHADGDATGAEVMRAMHGAVAARHDITVIEHHHLIDLIVDGDRVVGVLTIDRRSRFVAFIGPAVVLATGGVGRLYARTTNPPEVAAAGLAAAARSGAALADLEFVQFHPTALAGSTDPAPLLTEALRGEGALLVDDRGDRFMLTEHPDAELAPRDVVARGIWRRLQSGHTVYLDATDALGAAFPERFPTVWAHAQAAGLDPRVEPIAVEPAEHYHMGGIATDAWGRASLEGLWAVGEVASTGLHGANRLASNSLLEGLALGARAARAIAAVPSPPPPRALAIPASATDIVGIEDPAAEQRIRALMWDGVGIIRDAPGLRSVAEHLTSDRNPRTAVARDLEVAGTLVTDAAIARRESRGSHFRSDYPAEDRAYASRSHVVPADSPMTPVRMQVAA